MLYHVGLSAHLNTIIMSRSSAVCTHPKTRTWRFGVPVLSGVRNSPLFQNVQTGSAAHPASCSMDAAVLSRGQSGQEGWCRTLTFTITEAKNEWSLSLLLPYAFMARTGISLTVLLLLLLLSSLFLAACSDLKLVLQSSIPKTSVAQDQRSAALNFYRAQ